MSTVFDFIAIQKLLKYYNKTNEPKEIPSKKYIYSEINEKFKLLIKRKPELRHMVEYFSNIEKQEIIENYLHLRNSIDFDFKKSFPNIENENILKKMINNIDMSIKNNKLKTSNVLLYKYEKLSDIQTLYEYKIPLYQHNYIITNSTYLDMAESYNIYKTDTKQIILLIDYDSKEINTFSPNKVYLNKFYEDNTNKIVLERNTYIHILHRVPEKNIYYCLVTKDFNPPKKSKMFKSYDKLEKFYLNNFVYMSDHIVLSFLKITKKLCYLIVLDMLNVGYFNDIEHIQDIKNIDLSRYITPEIVKKYFGDIHKKFLQVIDLSKLVTATNIIKHLRIISD